MEMGQLTSAKTAPYLIALSTDFSIDLLISGGYSLSNPSSSWSDERRAPAYANVNSWPDGEWQRYERYHLQRIVILESHYASQWQ